MESLLPPREVESEDHKVQFDTGTTTRHALGNSIVNSDESQGSTPEPPELLRLERHRLEFRKAFDDNMKNKPIHHDRGFVLLISWDDSLDDLKVKNEVAELQSVFTDSYSFGVKWEKLENKKPNQATHQLNRYLSTFMGEHDEKDTLLIIYYAGHGSYQNNSVHLLASTSQQVGTEMTRNDVAWSSAENNIANTVADVLVIFDCCEAGGFGGHKVRYSRPSFEFIAACGKKERTRQPGKRSFTSALMWALKELRQEAPFSSITLVEKIKTYPHLPTTQSPELLRRDQFADGLVWIAPVNAEEAKREGVCHAVKRDPRHEYIDLRFNFYRKVTVEDAKNLAKHLSYLVNSEEAFEAKHVALLDVSSTFMKAIAAIRSNGSGKRRLSSTPGVEQSPNHSEVLSRSAKRRQIE